MRRWHSSDESAVHPHLPDYSTVSVSPTHHTWYTLLNFEVLFEAGTEMCDTMCEADLDYMQAESGAAQTDSSLSVMAFICRLTEWGPLWPAVALVEPLLLRPPPPPLHWLLPKHTWGREWLCALRQGCSSQAWSGNVDLMETTGKQCSMICFIIKLLKQLQPWIQRSGKRCVKHH